MSSVSHADCDDYSQKVHNAWITQVSTSHNVVEKPPQYALRLLSDAKHSFKLQK